MITSTVWKDGDECKLIQQMVEQMKADNTPVLYFEGYTPYFNDGDECLHRTTFFGPLGTTFDEKVVVEDGEDLKFKYTEETDLPVSSWQQGYRSKHPKATLLTNFMQRIIGTNRYGKITLQGDNLNFEVTYFDPEY